MRSKSACGSVSRETPLQPATSVVVGHCRTHAPSYPCLIGMGRHREGSPRHQQIDACEASRRAAQPRCAGHPVHTIDARPAYGCGATVATLCPPDEATRERQPRHSRPTAPRRSRSRTHRPKVHELKAVVGDGNAEVDQARAHAKAPRQDPNPGCGQRCPGGTASRSVTARWSGHTRADATAADQRSRLPGPARRRRYSGIIRRGTHAASSAAEADLTRAEQSALRARHATDRHDRRHRPGRPRATPDAGKCLGRGRALRPRAEARTRSSLRRPDRPRPRDCAADTDRRLLQPGACSGRLGPVRHDGRRHGPWGRGGSSVRFRAPRLAIYPLRVLLCPEPRRPPSGAAARAGRPLGRLRPWLARRSAPGRSRPPWSADRSRRLRRAGSTGSPPPSRAIAARCSATSSAADAPLSASSRPPMAARGRHHPASRSSGATARAVTTSAAARGPPARSSARPRTTVTVASRPSAVTASDRKAVRRASGSTRVIAEIRPGHCEHDTGQTGTRPHVNH